MRYSLRAFDIERKRFILNFFVHPRGEVLVYDKLDRLCTINAMLVRPTGITDVNNKHMYEFDRIEWKTAAGKANSGVIVFERGGFKVNSIPLYRLKVQKCTSTGTSLGRLK